MRADTFRLLFEGEEFFNDAGSNAISVSGDYGDDDHTEVSIEWMERGAELRLNIYFISDGNEWWSDGIEAQRADQSAYFEGEFFRSRLGQSFQGDVALESSLDDGASAELHFTGLLIEAFRPPPECAPPTSPYLLEMRYAMIEISACEGCSYSGGIQLRDGSCSIVTDQSDFLYRWSIDDATVATVKPKPDGCGSTGAPPCRGYWLEDLSPGTTIVHVEVERISSNQRVARGCIGLSVLPL